MIQLDSIRVKMKQAGADALLITMDDPHISEYVPDCYKAIQWLSGFSGSAGIIVVTEDFAGLWTDSRYFLQAGEQLRGSGVELVKLKVPHKPEFIGWMGENLPDGAVLAYDWETVSTGLARKIAEGLADKGLLIKDSGDLFSAIWAGRPSLPETELFDHPVSFAGLSREEKTGMLREEMKGRGIDLHMLTALDDIAWTFNIRASDIEYSPLAISFGLISGTGAWLFIDRKRIPAGLLTALEGAGISLLPYKEVYSFLGDMKEGRRMLVSPASTNSKLYGILKERCKIVEDISIPARLKSVKSEAETAHIRNAMVKDGVALTKFFCWVDGELDAGSMKEPAPLIISEMTIAEKLEGFRAGQEGFVSSSFATIAGYNEHGAIVHYQATDLTDSSLADKGLLLLDSGGQYLDGTTDITRTVALGKPTQKQKEDFTLVLKGTIALDRAVFPGGTKGANLDMLARKAMWERGLNYGHGTGHGVGYFLNVHEGPQGINPNTAGPGGVPLEAGMVISDEPGIYREGEYGIRIENLVVVKEMEDSGKEESVVGTSGSGEEKFLGFETLTLCYIDKSLIDTTMLCREEIKWINNYHKKVYDKLYPFLDSRTGDWLKEKTSVFAVKNQ